MPCVSDGTDVQRDLRTILWVQALRAFLYGFGTVILGTALARSGLSDLQVGAVFTAMLAGMAIVSLTVGALGDRLGRRRMYATLLAAMGIVGVVFALSGSFWVLFLAALTGTMSTDANESGPITTLEQAMIGRAPAAARVHVFGRYNAVAYLSGALGALAAGGPAFLHRAWTSAPSGQRWLLIFPVGAFVALVLVRRLSPAVEEAGIRAGRPLERSRRNVVRLSSLFAVDAFAGGLVVTSWIVFWFEKRFGASVELMSVVIFLGGLLQAGSSIVAARLGARFGLLHTMVFSHLPSNLLLAAIPLMPALGPAVGLLLARFALSQMDVPTRQAYIAAMVEPEERTAAAALTNTSRYVARPFGPVLGGVLMTNVAVGAPFVVAGGIKSLYDLVLWRVFSRTPLPEETSPPA